MHKVIKIIMNNGIYFTKDVKNKKEYAEKVAEIQSEKKFYELYKTCHLNVDSISSIEYVEFEEEEK